MESKNGADHHPKPPFRAEEELVQRGACCRPRTGPRRRERTVGQNHGESKDHVFDAPVTARFLARRARRDQPADCRPRQRARVMAEGHAP